MAKGTDRIVNKAIKLGVREDHAKAAFNKNTSDESAVAYESYVEQLEKTADEHFSKY